MNMMKQGGFAKFRFFLFSALFVIGVFGVWRGYEHVKKKYLYDFIANRLEIYGEKHLHAKLFVGHVSGNLFTHTTFENMQLKKIEGLPAEIQIKAKTVRLRYTPLQLLRKNPKVEVYGLELLYGSVRVPVKFTQQDNLITINLDKRYLYLNQIVNVFTHRGDVILKGLCEFKGVLILESLKPKFFELSVVSDNLEVIYRDFVKAKLNAAFSLKGEYSQPYLSGRVVIHEAEYTGEVGVVNLKDIPLGGIWETLNADVGIKGNNIRIKNKTVDAVVKADIQIKKQVPGLPYLVGKIETLKGNYTAYQNKFKITKAEIVFHGNAGSQASFSVSAQTKIRRYRILALVKGTLTSSQLELNAEPVLPKEQILALLLFGRKIEKLNVQDRKGLLNNPEIAESLINKLFLGKAEAKVAQLLHLDDISVQANLKANSTTVQMPGVEVGKYLNGEKLYGMYQIQPSAIKNRQATQAIAGEYSVTENLRVKGSRSFVESYKIPQEDRVEIQFKWKY